MKKFIAIITILVLMVGVLPVTNSLAHNDKSASSTKYSTCKVKSCNKMINHKHQGKTYKGHSANKAKAKKIKLCNVKKCNKSVNHKHKGKLYKGHKKNDGHKYHKTKSGHGSNHH